MGRPTLARRSLSAPLTDLRNDIFRKLQSLSFGFHDRQQTGNLMSKATADVDAVRMFISMGMIRGLSIFMMLGMVGAIMFTMNWRLALVSFAFIPVVIWRAIVMSRTLRGTWMQVQSRDRRDDGGVAGKPGRHEDREVLRGQRVRGVEI